jgi:N-terminal domain of toast_rack, DUF2154/LiaI-LiaF-like transmembrane region
MPEDRGSRTPSLVFPILLIVIGGLFLYATWRPAFDPWPILRTYWPLILIFVGLGKMWDASRRRTAQGASTGFPVGSTIGILAFVVVLVVLLLHGRNYARRYDDLDHKQGHSSEVVDLQNAKAVHASIEMGAGQLNVNGGATHLLESEFTFSRSWEQPRVEYHVTNGSGELTISQESSGPHIGPSDNTWTLHFSNDVPLDLKIDLGAGQSNLKLHGMNVTRLTVDMGAGEANVDLTGPRSSDLTADIEGGVGQATVRLPKDIGVVATASGGIGNIRTHGLIQDGDEYKNEAYGKSPHTIHLKVEGGIGQINLEQEP